VRLRLIIFDVDGTLIPVRSSWQYLHKKLGTWNRGRKYAQLFFEGRISYEDWARLDASLWRGIPIARVRQIVRRIPYVRGAPSTIRVLKERGYRIVLLSAGLSVITDRISRELGVDGAIANELLVRDGVLTGEVNVQVSFHNKDQALQRLLPRFGVDVKECAAVGDDETMIPLFRRVGLAIAFNPQSPIVERNAHVTVRSENLQDILPHLP